MLRLENLSVEVDGRRILNNINLHIKEGEVHVLFGPNGTGKSTLVGAIIGFSRYKITSGKIVFNGIDVTNLLLDERARLGMGIMIQRPPTLRGLSLRKMVELCSKNAFDIENIAQETNLTYLLERGVNEGFSGGEIKRSELLQLIAQQPDLLLLDEPESGVDIENIVLVGAGINRILGRDINAKNKSVRKSGLIITHTGHILDYVDADIAHVMYNGTLACYGEPQKMLNCIKNSGYEACVKCMIQERKI